jgi:hypothetical protein
MLSWRALILFDSHVDKFTNPLCSSLRWRCGDSGSLPQFDAIEPVEVEPCEEVVRMRIVPGQNNSTEQSAMGSAPPTTLPTPHHTTHLHVRLLQQQRHEFKHALVEFFGKLLQHTAIIVFV